MAFDTIIRGGTIATASDTFACDVGIRAGVVAALGADLGEAREVVDDGKEISFTVVHNQREVSRFVTPLMGRMNVRNALGVSALCLELGLSAEEIAPGLASFLGVENYPNFCLRDAPVEAADRLRVAEPALAGGINVLVA